MWTVAIAVAALAGPFGSASARPGQQAPPATATPHPPRPPSAGISGLLPACSASMTAAPATAALRADDVVTITARVRFDCPRLLERRAVLLLFGSLPPSTAAGEALAQVVDGVARYGTSQVAVIDVAAPDASLAWASSADDLAALAARLRALEPRTRVSRAADWLAAFDTVERAIRALPPTLRPLLVVADGVPPTGDIDSVVARLLDVVHLSHDAVGHSVLLGLAPEVWFELPSSLDPTFGQRAIVVRWSGVDSSESLRALSVVLGSLQSPLTRMTLQYVDVDGRLEPVASEPPAAVANLGAAGTFLAWAPAVAGYSAAETVRASLRAAASDVRGRVILSASAQRTGARSDAAPPAVVAYCIDPTTPRPAQCDPAAAGTATPTPFGLRTPTRPGPPTTPDRPPPRLTEPSIVPPATGAPVDGARLWLPVALRRP